MKRNLLVPLFTVIALNLIGQQNCSNCPALPFKENKGQWNKCVLYAAELQNGAFYLSQDSFTFLLADTSDMNRIRHSHHPWMYNPHLDLNIHIHVFRQVFEGANRVCKVNGSNKLNEYFNFYLGKNPSNWASNVHAFYTVNYANLYNNIDLEVTSQGPNVKYDFVVKPGGDPLVIRMKYVGANAMQLAQGKDLLIKTSIGDIIDTRPSAWQEIRGEKQAVQCDFVLKGNTVSLDFPGGYDKGTELIIDPTLIFSTESGSMADNFGYSATYDNQGNAYAAGSIFQFYGTYPTTPGAFQISWAGGVGFGNANEYDGTGTDVGITKYDSLGHTRIYSTYLGGDHDELPHSLIVNSNGELFVLGSTASDNFPVTPSAFDMVFKGGPDMGVFDGIGVHYATGSDIFITHFNSTGTALIGSTYVGGTGNDGLTYPEYVGLNYNYADDVRGEINIDVNGNIYVASTTRSKDFPVTAGAFQTSLADTSADSSDAVVFKMDANLSHMIWSTYLGGSDNDAAYSIDFDPNGDLYVSGGTISTDFPVTTGVIQRAYGGGRADGFIVHLSQNGNAILQSTYLGSPEYDQAYFVRADKVGNVYTYGQTEAQDSTFIHNAAYNKWKGGQFITKLSSGLDSIIWSTTFGTGKGTPDISPTAFLVDVCNKTYISGWGSDFYKYYGIVGAPPLTTGGLQITSDAVQKTTDSADFYIMVMADDASALNYATYFGSPTDEDHVDGGTSRFDKRGVIYESACSNCGGQDSFPTTPGAVSRRNGSLNCNNAVFKINFDFPIMEAAFTNTPANCIPDTVTFNNQSQIYDSATYQWNFGDGTSSTEYSPSHAYTQSGIYTVQLIVTDPPSCNYIDTITHQVTVLANTSADTIPTLDICKGHEAQIGITTDYDSAIQYQWIPSTYLTQANISNPFADPPQTTNYELIVSRGTCSDTFRQAVKVDTNVLSTPGGALLCMGDTATLNVINSDTSQHFAYSWKPLPSIISGATTANPEVKPTQSTTFVLTAINQSGCAYIDSALISIVSSLPSVRAVANPDTIKYGDTTQLGLTLSANVVSFNWLPDSTIIGSLTASSLQADPRNTDAYVVLVADSGGCKKYDTVIVYVLNPPCASSNIFIPNAFTPNGDGKNDVLYLRGNELSNIYFAVYDRWGQRMFETTNITEGWDGTYKGKKLDPAVFGYYAKGECATGEHFEKRGNVTLLR